MIIPVLQVRKCKCNGQTEPKNSESRGNVTNHLISPAMLSSSSSQNLSKGIVPERVTFHQMGDLH